MTETKKQSNNPQQDQESKSAGGKGGKQLAGMAGSWVSGLKGVKMSNPLKSVGLKLFMFIFVGIVACVLTVGLLAYSQAKQLIERNVAEASYQTVRQVAHNLDVVFQNYDSLALQLVIDPDIRTQLSTYSRSTDVFDELQAIREVANRLGTYMMTSDTLSAAAIIPLQEGKNSITAGTVQLESINRALTSTWLEATIANEGRTYWIKPSEQSVLSGGPTNAIGAARLMRNIDGSKFDYVLVLEFKSGPLTDTMADVQLGQNSDLSIVDAEGNYVLSGNPLLTGQPYLADLSQADMESNSATIHLANTEGSQLLAAYQNLSRVNWHLIGAIPVEELVRDAKVIQTLTWAMVACAAVIAIIIGAIVIFSIARPLVVLRNLMVKGANGDLAVRSPIKKRKDEIGELSDSFNEMMTQIAGLATQTTHSAAEVLSTAAELTDASKKTAISSKEISIATEEIAKGATSLATEAEKGSDLTSHINDQVKQVTEANRQMSLSAGEVEQASRQGTAYMEQLIEKTGRTEEMTRSMVEKVDSLKESTGSIVKILDVLDNITKQTNILSLNASIEAARAGAAGKGFAVVADEIRKLADESRRSIDVVGQITERIQSEIDETVYVLSDAYPLFQEQIASVKEANSIFKNVQVQMGEFVERIDQATSSIGELNRSQTVLYDAMTSVSAVAEQSSATSEEVASLSSEQLGISQNLVGLSDKLDAVSNQLKESLSRFRM